MLANSVWNLVFGMPQVIFVMGGLVAVVAIGGSYWSEFQKAQSENRLKRSMVERGMNADEIERIMATRTNGDGKNDQV